ncbi:MAG TPA: Uma2 family endonuclease [Thermoanaerobaculia bacterium]|jgi:Uma2 family endonuclease|nr:Uma2 family endonuclease [Thermoanaerobaculia bacterium]
MNEPAYPLTPSDDRDLWPGPGHWTFEDYLRLPDDGQRYEVLRGKLYVTPAPAYDHQFPVTKLTSFLDVFVTKRDLGVLLVAPFDVRLPERLADPVEPDLVFFRKGNEPQSGDKYFEGVPDLVIEVLSPKSRRVDHGTKMEIYREAGIPEYWLVDPLARAVLIYRLDEGRVYVEWARARESQTVTSAVLPGLKLTVSSIFPRKK